MTDTTTALAAGRELDAMVRDAVFGLWDESRCRVCGWKIVPDGEQGCWRDNCSMRFPDGMRPPRVDQSRYYSTDIAAAWEIVEQLLHRPDPRGSWAWVIKRFANPVAIIMAGEWEIAFAQAETMPLAICRVALKALHGAPAAREPT